MNPIAIVAFGAISPLGRGREAFGIGAAGEAPRSTIAIDPTLVEAGFKKPWCSRAQVEAGVAEDRATALLLSAYDDLARSLEAVLPNFRERRVGLVLGTSGGGLSSLEVVTRERALGRDVPPSRAKSSLYFGAFQELERVLGVELAEKALILSACSSATVALSVGALWLDAGHLDIVIAGGFDALTTFVAAGFEALGATSNGVPRPFRQDREGMALGEGAALCALVREEDRLSPAEGYVLGAGISADAVHTTAPDRTGNGLARAAERALAEAGVLPASVGLVSAHATATPFNDAAEAHAIATALGPGAERAVVHPYKAVIGHALGAAGILESLAALEALRLGILPAALGTGAIEPNLSARLLERNTPGQGGVCLKLSTAFGGANAALTLAARCPSRRRPPSEPRRVTLRAVGRPKHEIEAKRLAEKLGVEELRLARIDPVSALAVAACESALEGLDTGLPRDSGVLVATIAATLELDRAFDVRIQERGVRAAEPRRFPPTSPNLAAAECSILFGLQGPSFAVGSGLVAPLEALLLAFDILAAGWAPAMLVVAADCVGPGVTDLMTLAGLPVPTHGAMALVLEAGDASEPAPLPRDLLVDLRNQAEVPGRTPGWPSLSEAAVRLRG